MFKIKRILILFIPNFAIELILRRKYSAQKYVGKFRDYLAKQVKFLTKFNLATLRANFANACLTARQAKFGFIIFALISLLGFFLLSSADRKLRACPWFSLPYRSCLSADRQAGTKADKLLKIMSVKNESLIKKIETIENQQQIKENKELPKKNVYPDYPFRIGEKLKYGIYSAAIKVGNVLISYLGNKEIDGNVVSLITLEAKAPGFYDFEEIYGDIEQFAPLKVTRKINLFGEDACIIEEYNQKNNQVLITRKAKKITIKKIESKGKINNVILLLYYFRNQKNKYKIGDKIKFNLPTKSMEMLMEKEVEINVPMGRFKAFFIRSIPSNFKVWFSKDERNLPLRINGAIGFGNTYLSLIETE